MEKSQLEMDCVSRKTRITWEKQNERLKKERSKKIEKSLPEVVTRIFVQCIYFPFHGCIENVLHKLGLVKNVLRSFVFKNVPGHFW